MENYKVVHAYCDYGRGTKALCIEKAGELGWFEYNKYGWDISLDWDISKETLDELYSKHEGVWLTDKKYKDLSPFGDYFDTEEEMEEAKTLSLRLYGSDKLEKTTSLFGSHVGWHVWVDRDLIFLHAGDLKGAIEYLKMRLSVSEEESLV